MRVQGERLLIFPGPADDVDRENRAPNDDHDSENNPASKPKTLQAFLRQAVSHQGLCSLEVSCVPLTPPVVDAVARVIQDGDLPSLSAVSVVACPASRRSTKRLLSAVAKASCERNLESLTWQEVAGEQDDESLEEEEEDSHQCDDRNFESSQNGGSLRFFEKEQHGDSFFKVRHQQSLTYDAQNKTKPTSISLKSLKLQAAITSDSIWLLLLKNLLYADESNGLEELTLDGSTFDDDALKVLTDTLPRSKTLKSLRMKWCRLSNSSICSIVRGLADLKQLRELDLTGNFCLDAGMRACGRLTQIRTLGLSHQEVPAGLSPLAKSMAFGPQERSLHTLQLSGNQLGDDDMIHLESLLTAAKNIRIIDLSNNLLGDDGIQKVAEAAARAPELRVLHLRGNPFGVLGAKALADLVEQRHVGLEVIELEWSKTIRRRRRRVLPGRNNPTPLPAHAYLYYTCSPLEFGDILSQEHLCQLYQEYRAYCQKIAYFTSLNVGGRRLLRSTADVPQGLWSHILARAFDVTPEHQCVFSTVHYLLLGPALANRGNV